MPAVENSSSENVIANNEFWLESDIQFTRYFGLFLLALTSKITEKIAKLVITYRVI